MNNQRAIKIITVGDTSVGKTTFIQRIKNNFQLGIPAVSPTIGCDFTSKIYDLNDKKIKYNIWDTSGQEQYKSLTKSFFSGSQGAFLFFDITDQKSFIGAQNWLKDIRDQCDPNIQILLIANKEDQLQFYKSQGKPVVEEIDIKNFSLQNNIEYFLISSKNDSDKDIKIVFDNLLSKTLDKCNDIVYPNDDNEKLKKNHVKPKKNKCC